MKEINLPYNFKPRDYQLELLLDKRRFKIAVIHRRGGKTKTVLNQQVCRTQMKYSKELCEWMSPDDPRLTEKERNAINVYLYCLPTYRAAKAVVWDQLVKEHVPMELVDTINKSELSIYYKNGSIQRFVGTEDPDLHRGINPIDVVFDEFSEMDSEMWDAIIQPVLAENHGTATFIFTPKGKNHSYELIEFAKRNPKSWFVTVKNVDDTKGIDQEELDRVKESTPQALYNQEYMCEFSEGSGSLFRRVRENTYKANGTPEPGHLYQIGIDLAKYNDWTVITPFDLNTFKVKTPDRFNQVDWNLQEARISANAFRYGNAQLILDRTGVGDSVVDHLEDQGLNIGEEGRFVFTANSKKDLLYHLALLLEKDKIKIPDDEILISELESIQCGLTDKGQLKIITPRNMHDDMVMSLALAVWNIPEEPLGIFNLNRMTTSSDTGDSNSESLYEAI